MGADLHVSNNNTRVARAAGRAFRACNTSNTAAPIWRDWEVCLHANASLFVRARCARATACAQGVMRTLRARWLRGAGSAESTAAAASAQDNDVFIGCTLTSEATMTNVCRGALLEDELARQRSSA